MSEKFDVQIVWLDGRKDRIKANSLATYQIVPVASYDGVTERFRRSKRYLDENWQGPLESYALYDELGRRYAEIYYVEVDE